MSGAASPLPERRGELRHRGYFLIVEADDDVAALRASLNMWLRLVSVAQEMQDLIIDQERTA